MYRPRCVCVPSARKVSSGPYEEEDRPSAPSPTQARKATRAIEWRVSLFMGSSGLPRMISRIFLFFIVQAALRDGAFAQVGEIIRRNAPCAHCPPRTLVSLPWHVLICAPALAASVAELVDALDSKSSAERRAGSIPAGGTTSKHQTVSSCIIFSSSTLKVENPLALFDPPCIIPSQHLVGTSDGTSPSTSRRYQHARQGCH